MASRLKDTKGSPEHPSVLCNDIRISQIKENTVTIIYLANSLVTYLQSKLIHDSELFLWYG